MSKSSSSSSAHTPGPWKAEKLDDSDTGATQWYVLAVEGSDDSKPAIAEIPGDKPKDARLIAAAPDLLEACKMLMVSTIDASLPLNQYVEIVKQGKDAIAKAEG